MLQQSNLSPRGLVLPFTGAGIFFQHRSDILRSLDPTIHILRLVRPLPGILFVHDRVGGWIGTVLSHAEYIPLGQILESIFELAEGLDEYQWYQERMEFEAGIGSIRSQTEQGQTYCKIGRVLKTR